RKSFAMGLMAVGGSLLFTAVLLEAGLRAWHNYPSSQAEPASTGVRRWIAPAEDIGYRLHPDWERFSAQGSQTEVAGRPAERFRILILGDSVAFNGKCFEDSIPGHIERTLDAARDVVPTETLNSSVPGYTNYQELVWLKEYGLEFEPDLVGIIFVMNDLHRMLHDVDARPGEPFAAADLPFTSDAAHPPSSSLSRGVAQRYPRRSLRRRLP
ncbi:MAG: SGNH/GDSL hydrolase family protein, partial [bacterium]|nr:SGNH/GDSL hydrolase family protein [bacterium]